MKGKTKTQSEISILFQTVGATLLGQYIRSSDRVQYRCCCGQIDQISPNALIQRIERHQNPCRHAPVPKETHESVRSFFAAHGCTLLTETYTSCNQRLRFLCSCGRATAETCFRLFKSKGGTKCKKCISEMRSALGRGIMQRPEVKAKYRQTLQQNYGVRSPLQNPDVRQKREQTCLQRYGVRSVSQDPAIQKRQREGYMQKHGVSHFMKNPDAMSKYRQTLLQRYGATSLAFVSRRSSLAAQRFFEEVFLLLPVELQSHAYFSPHTREFNIWHEGRYFKFDFVHTGLKKAIEYNGSRFHPRPEQKDDETGWCLFRPHRTVKEAREYEQKKLDGLRKRDFEILVVWDTEVKHDRHLSIQLCVGFLLGQKLHRS